MNTRRSIAERCAILGASLVMGPAVWAQSTATAPRVPVPVDTMPMEANYVLLGLAIVQVIFIISLAGIMRTMGGTGAWAKAVAARAARAGVLLPVLLLATADAHAQTHQASDGTLSNTHLFWWLAAANIFFFLVILVQVNLLRGLIKAVTGIEPKLIVSAEVGEPAWIGRLMERLTRRVASEREQDVLMHHEYDGIRELDNVLPPWWVWLFYGTIIWGLIYLVNVHVINIWPDQKTEYANEMKHAKDEVAAYMATLTNLVDESNVTASTDAPTLASGKAIFEQYCVACHGKLGEGGVGPNFADAYWIHGGGIRSVFKTIKYGVQEKGMISWRSQLKPAEMQAVASYLLTFQGTSPPNAKAPQGDLWSGEAAPTDSTAAPVDSLAAPADTARLAAN